MTSLVAGSRLDSTSRSAWLVTARFVALALTASWRLCGRTPVPLRPRKKHLHPTLRASSLRTASSPRPLDDAPSSHWRPFIAWISRGRRLPSPPVLGRPAIATRLTARPPDSIQPIDPTLNGRSPSTFASAAFIPSGERLHRLPREPQPSTNAPCRHRFGCAIQRVNPRAATEVPGGFSSPGLEATHQSTSPFNTQANRHHLPRRAKDRAD